MRTSTVQPRPRQAPCRHSRHGAALVIVLSALVLISLLVVAFFSSVSKELESSKSYASGASAKIYADAAVNLVISQLRASTGLDDASVTWVSQPGLIRQFDDSGRQQRVYKLYSSNEMVAAGTFSPAQGGETPTDVPAWTAGDPQESLPWNAQPGVYTDLNRPAVVHGEVKYPILNPGGLNADTRVQGFEVAPGYGIADTEDWDGDGDRAEISQIPMPVRWLYILSDGSFASAEPTGDRTVKLVLPGGATPAEGNPPVARVAFWTDDDTSRLNINTASEGNFWTVQVAAGADDSLATNQINNREYQRYPGHPATTSLSPVLDFLTDNPSDLRNFIFAMTPRVSGRGSQFGSRYIGFGMPVNVDNDRLYASVDELLFLPGWDSTTGRRYPTSTQNIASLKSDQLDWNFTSSSKFQMTGTPHSFATSFELDPQRLEIARFFLTAQSRAPELNLFGRPRISLWPVDTRASHQGLHDKLLAFTATANGAPYYFQRQDPASQTADYADIPRNQELLTYLDRHTSAKIPGFGEAFSSKYNSGDLAALRANIFDWVRTVNLAYRDKTGVVEPYAWEKNSSPSGTTRPPGLPGSGQVLPIKIGGTQGIGRFPTLSKGALAIIKEKETVSGNDTIMDFRVLFVMETYVPMLGYAGYVPDYTINVSGLANAFEFISAPTAGAAPSVQPVPLSFNDGSMRVTAPSNFETFSGRAWGGTQGFNNLFLYCDTSDSGTLKPRQLGTTDPDRGYPYISQTVQVTCPTIDKDDWCVGLRPVNGAVVSSTVVDIKDVTGAVTVTSHSLPFPGFGPVAGAKMGNPASGNGSGSVHAEIQERVNQMATAGQATSGNNGDEWRMYKNVVANTLDIIRGLELEHGDLRLLAMHGTSGSHQFVPHREYSTTSAAQANSLLRSAGSVYGGLQRGKGSVQSSYYPKRGYLVSGTRDALGSGTAWNYLPQVPSAVSDIRTSYAPGDFSTGIASEGDGPHVIKADEGNSSFGGMNWGMSAQFPYQNQLFPYDNRLSDAFSPNRQVTSAVQLGTLPAKGDTGIPWRTLLFRPDFDDTHPGNDVPADHLLLDLFWMPVVDPYPISEPLSTAGKINMNYQIAPFTYIDRSTSLRGALKSVKMLAIPKEHAEWYKWTSYTVDLSKKRYPISYLYTVDEDKTLMFFQDRFAGNNPDTNIFRSASEICSIPLAPRHNASSPVSTGHPETPPLPAAIDGRSSDIFGASAVDTLRTRIKDFWDLNTLTGDNVLEAPYNSLYPRLTTQSNTYTVYVRVQALQVAPSAAAGTFSDRRDSVISEYRGSQTIHRFIDPNDVAIPDLAASDASGTLYPYYRFEVKGAKQFIP